MYRSLKKSQVVSSGFELSPLACIPPRPVRAAIWLDNAQLPSRCPTRLPGLHSHHPARRRTLHRCPFLSPLQSDFERPAG